jgi:hypothetical protein
MEQNKIEEQKPAEDKEEEKMTLWDHIKMWGTIIGLLLFVGWIGYGIHPDASVKVEKVEDGSAFDRGYNQGRDEGIQYGVKQERAEWCEPGQYKKPGDMMLKCLKLFLDGAGESIRQRNGVEIKTL